MIVKRGEIWLADLNPIRGSEQAGVRPVLIFQRDTINRFTTTVWPSHSRQIYAVLLCLHVYELSKMKAD